MNSAVLNDLFVSISELGRIRFKLLLWTLLRLKFIWSNVGSQKSLTLMGFLQTWWSSNIFSPINKSLHVSIIFRYCYWYDTSNKLYAGGLVLLFLSQAVASENKNVWRQLSGIYLGLDQTKKAAFEDSLEDLQLSMSETYIQCVFSLWVYHSPGFISTSIIQYLYETPATLIAALAITARLLVDVFPMAFYGRDLLVSRCHGRRGHLDCNGWCANERPETSLFANAALQRGRVDMSPTSQRI